MQKQKSCSSNRSGSSDVPLRTSPATPRSSRISRTGDHDSNAVTPTRTSTERISKAIERRSPRSPANEKRRPSRISELEAQVSRLREDLKKTKDQLSLSKALKKQAEKETDDAKKQLEAITEKLEDSQHQLVDFSSSEEARLHGLQQISQERDRAWQSELEALQSQHSADKAALSSAIKETQKLKSQLDMVLKSEASEPMEFEDAKFEIQDRKQNLEQALATIEKLKVEVQDSHKANAEAQIAVSKTKQQLESAKGAIETLHTESAQLRESLSSTDTKLEESRAEVVHLEEIVESVNATILSDEIDADIIFEVTDAISPGAQLRSALEAVETKKQALQVHCATKINAAYELVEHEKSNYRVKEAELQQALQNVKSEIIQLKATLVDREAELRRISDINAEDNKENGTIYGNRMQSEMETKLMRSVKDKAEQKSNLMEKEAELQRIVEENKILKSDVDEKEVENHKNYDAAVAELELTKTNTQDLILQLGYITEEAENSSRKATRMAERLDATQAVNLEMENELKRLRIQSEQWRKAAEAAAAVLTTGNAGRLTARTGSLDSDYNSVADKLMGSPFSDDLDNETKLKKNKNVMKKIGGLWKKGPK